ncbi:MAG: caspase family protein [Bacteroidia bacterium]|nr:caspase family protein [Bacteroidia bacterium]
MKKLAGLKNLYLLIILSFFTHLIYAQQSVDSVEKILSGLPKISWISPLSSNFMVKSPNINIKATIKSGTGLNSVMVFINDVSAGEPFMKPSSNMPGSFTVEKSLTLTEGDNIIYFVASNNLGSTTSAKKYVAYQQVLKTYDSTAISSNAVPVIHWTSPSEQLTTTRSSKASIKASIRSNIGLNSVILYINDVSAGEPQMSPAPNNIGSFIVEKTLNLNPGENRIFLEASNNKGTIKSDLRYFDYQPVIKETDSVELSKPNLPVISWTNPIWQNTTLKSLDVSIKATVKSVSGLNSVVLFLNGVLYGEPEMKPSPTVPGNFYITKTVRVNPGENNIYIIAANNLGETISDKRFLTFPSVVTAAKQVTNQVEQKAGDNTILKPPDEAPLITWTNPVNSSTALKSPLINIAASVKSGSGLNSVVLYLNGTSTGEAEIVPSTEGDATFNIEKTINLKNGENIIYLIATNSSGTTKSETRNLTAPSVAEKPVTTAIQNVPETVEAASKKPTEIPPSITWTSPSKLNTTLSTSNTILRATIKTTSGLNSVLLYMNGVSIGEPDMKPSPSVPGSFIIEKTIKFVPGQSNVYLEATNSGGTSKSEIRYFTNPFEEPPVNPVAEKAEPVKTEQAKVESAPKPLAGPPVIAWISPSASKTTMDSYNATVKANIRSGSGLNSVLLYLNGVSKGETDIRSSPDNPESFLVEKNLNFGPGENNIYLVVTDIEGTTAKSEIRYFSNPSAILPEINWATPENPNSIVGAESFVISASIKSPTDLKSVKLYVNADVQSEDNVFDAAVAGEGNYNWENSVLLRKGENSIYIVAMNAAGSTRSEKRVIKFEENLTEKRLALVFGNSQYSDKPPLKNPVNDANLMAATLKELGFDVIKRLDAKRDEMMGAIREFNEKLPDYSVALFYYAGHGNQVDGKNYLIPTDAVLEKPGDCKFEAIGVDFIVEEFERYPDNTNIVILDACRDNPFATWSRVEIAGFKTISFSSGTIIVFATSEGATAADGRGANGLFTEVLVKQMLVPQSIFSVVMKTRVEVRRLSNNQQTPMEWNKLNGDFYFKK